MSNAARWFERYPKVVLACLASFVLGVLAAYALGWLASESAAALLGALVGAAAAVAGAFWVADANERARKRDLGAAVVALVEPLRDSAVTAVNHFKQPKSVREQQDLDYKAAYAFWRDCEAFDERLHRRFQLPLNDVGVAGLAKLAELEKAVSELSKMVEPGFGDAVDPTLAAEKYLNAARLIKDKATRAIEHCSGL